MHQIYLDKYVRLDKMNRWMQVIVVVVIVVLVIAIIIAYNYRLYIHLWKLPDWKDRQVYLREMLRQIVTILQRHRISHFAVDGTLLGLIRNGDVIPYDTDVDLGIFYKDRSRVVTLLQRELPKEYTVGHMLKLGRVCPLQVIHKPTGVHTDIESYFHLGNNKYQSGYSTPKGDWSYQHVYDIDYLLPVRYVRCSQGRFRVPVPRKSEKILRMIYGPKWHKESMTYNEVRDRWVSSK